MMISTQQRRTPETPLWDSRRLWSLWEMLELSAPLFMKIIINHRTLLMSVARSSGPLSNPMKQETDIYTKGIQEFCRLLGLETTLDLANWIKNANTVEALREAMDCVERGLNSELQQRIFFEPSALYKMYFKQEELFGREVFDAFGSANDDIFEAGMCLALERGTACVMHLMRVMETGLSALAKALGIAQQNDWGSYIRLIEKELETRYKSAGARSPDEQFYAEAAANFDRMRRAWRNPTMHPDKSYSPERAEEILLAIKSFMAHLATRLHD